MSTLKNRADAARVLDAVRIALADPHAAGALVGALRSLVSGDVTMASAFLSEATAALRARPSR